MKDPRRNLDRIPKENLTAYERWELPLLDARGNEVAREEEREVKPLTAADIDDIRQAAHEDGHSEGREAGYQAGFSEGRGKGYQEGYEAGVAEGREQGTEQGLAETRKEVDVKLDRLEHLLGELLVPIQRHEDEVETALVNLTTVLARAVVFRELSLDSSHITEVVRHAMASLPSTSENVRVHIHPDDYQWVSEVAGKFEAATSIVEDASILRGGCKLETRHSLVDFTVEKRFQKAIQGMLDKQLDTEKAGDVEELDAMMSDLTDFQHGVLDSDQDESRERETDEGKAKGESDDGAPG
ncbi:flagellar assembly protein FliH [Marinobacter panjinensis]|uniref:Flagellar assembly protein FliH n=1 Tax=Marinobacter panjinensis TaxID=2576384 RepID=A0A4U6R3X7_9GAMM|nr:flagellar assembly protein FliH [Marinobacter panjinensis]MCR8913791.1 flagellar assembly protein FliH [Marinobacter panjinensis]TKV67568.1 flagellar assembly protein FliH [Marinobacter panjinensis]